MALANLPFIIQSRFIHAIARPGYFQGMPRMLFFAINRVNKSSTPLFYEIYGSAQGAPFSATLSPDTENREALPKNFTL
jgi:hypothetical protein